MQQVNAGARGTSHLKECIVQDPTPLPLAHSPESAAKRLGLPVRAIYTLLADGELRSTKIGKRRLIPDIELQRLLERKLQQAA